MTHHTLGRIAFLGSGETSLAGGRIFEAVARNHSRPLRIAILETTAGFELNSAQVAGRVADFLKTRLQNYAPIVNVIPARKLGTEFSPDNPDILTPMLYADILFMGPGSPTYAARQLQGTLAWDILRARHRLGATLVFASAATIAVGAHALPVYEIYKVGEDVHTKPGLDLFADYGVHLSFIPHWNNADGGLDLDTSRCFVGMERFAKWCDLLPPGHVTLGLDEHTGVIFDFETDTCEVSGVSTVSLVRVCNPEIFPSGAKIPLVGIGDFRMPSELSAGISPQAWQMVTDAPPLEGAGPPEAVLELLARRAAARAAKDFTASDVLRDQIAALGWQVQDGRDGQKLVRI
ncbi:MAG: cysteinyl-tRNA synthetase [Chloroflexi bacterium]|nr:cysteinyl-tRNA synthetase [Chloroflexota bacterium]